MRINGYRCDGCGKEHLLDIPHGTDPFRSSQPQLYETLPDDWFMVNHGKPSATSEPWLFCSETCLRQAFTDTEQRYAAQHFPPDGRTLQELLLDALTTDGSHHVQWYLWRIAEALHVDTSEVLRVADKGIAP